MFGRKKRILRKSIKQEVELMRTLKAKCESGDIPPEQCVQIKARWEEIAALLTKIAPAEALTHKQLIVRFGLIGVVLMLAGGGIGIYVKQTYFPHQAITQTEAQGDVNEFRYVATRSVSGDKSRVFRVRGQSKFFDIARTEENDGRSVGVLKIGDEELDVLFTQNNNDLGNLYSQRYSKDPFEQRGTPQQRLSQYQFSDAAVMSLGEDILVFGAINNPSEDKTNERFTLMLVDADYNIKKQTFFAQENSSESLLGLNLTPVYEAQAVSDKTKVATKKLTGFFTVTVEDEKPAESGAAKKKPIIRKFDLDLNSEFTKVLDSRQLTLSNNITMHAKDGGGLLIASAGKDPIRDAGKSDDDLYMIEYDSDYEPLEIIELIRGGGAHEFSMNELLSIDGSKTLLYPFYKHSRISIGKEKKLFPDEAGIISIIALNDTKLVKGTFFSEEYDRRVDANKALRGGMNLHTIIDNENNHLYMVHDSLTEEDRTDEIGDGSYRTVKFQSIRYTYEEK